MSYEIAIINPRKRKSRKRASKAQISARRRFVAKFAKGRKSRKVRKVHKSTSGVSIMAKRRRRKSKGARNAKGHFVKKTHKARAKRVRRRRSSGGARRAAVGYTVGSRRIRRRKLNPRMIRRRKHRNPRGLFGLPSMGSITGQLMNAGLGAAGGLGLNLALSYIPLPESLKTGWPRHGVRLVGAFGLGMLAKRFLGAKGQAVATGALTVVMYDILKQVIGGVSPEIGTRLGEFEDVSLGSDDIDFIDPASPLDGNLDGTGAYLNGPGSDDSGTADDMGTGAYLQGDLDGQYEEIMV